jgi:hypothetical protein
MSVILPGGIIESLLDVADDILSVREEIGAAIHYVYRVTRTWSGESCGDGTFEDISEKITPTPGFRDLSLSLRSLEGGFFQRGDVIIQGISKQSYPDKSAVALECSELNVEKFYKIDEKLFQVIHVRESYVTWDVHVRAVNDAYG